MPNLAFDIVDNNVVLKVTSDYTHGDNSVVNQVFNTSPAVFAQNVPNAGKNLGPSTSIQVDGIKATEQTTTLVVSDAMQTALNEYKSGAPVAGAPTSNLTTFSNKKLEELQTVDPTKTV